MAIFRFNDAVLLKSVFFTLEGCDRSEIAALRGSAAVTCVARMPDAIKASPSLPRVLTRQAIPDTAVFLLHHGADIALPGRRLPRFGGDNEIRGCRGKIARNRYSAGSTLGIFADRSKIDFAVLEPGADNPKFGPKADCLLDACAIGARQTAIAE